MGRVAYAPQLGHGSRHLPYKAHSIFFWFASLMEAAVASLPRGHDSASQLKTFSNKRIRGTASPARPRVTSPVPHAAARSVGHAAVLTRDRGHADLPYIIPRTLVFSAVSSVLFVSVFSPSVSCRHS